MHARNQLDETMRGTKLLIVCAVMLLVATAGQVQASIISVNDAIFGVDSVTRDTNTGKEWLDWTESANISYNDMVTQLGLGGQFDGWRHATQEEVGVLFADMGVGVSNWPYTTSVDDFGVSADYAMGFLGVLEDVTFNGGYFTRANAFTSDIFGPDSRNFVSVESLSGLMSLTVGDGSRQNHLNYAGIGHALVRVYIPEPTTLVIWSLLGGIGLVVRYRRH